MFVFRFVRTEFAIAATPDFSAAGATIAFSHGAQSYKKSCVYRFSGGFGPDTYLFLGVLLALLGVGLASGFGGRSPLLLAYGGNHPSGAALRIPHAKPLILKGWYYPIP